MMVGNIEVEKIALKISKKIRKAEKIKHRKLEKNKTQKTREFYDFMQLMLLHGRISSSSKMLLYHIMSRTSTLMSKSKSEPKPIIPASSL